MRIALRTSGGRGEYELTGDSGEFSASDLFDRRLIFQISPEISLDAHQRARRLQGKPRIRLEQPGRDRHAYLLLTDILLLPRPIREIRQTLDSPDFVRDGGYSVAFIDVDVAEANGEAELRPTHIWLTNVSGLAQSIDFAERMAAVQAVWATARDEGSHLAGLLREHERAVEQGDHQAILVAASALRVEFGLGTDILPTAAAELGVGLEEAPLGGGPLVDGVPDEETEETDPQAAIRRAISKWRRQAVRDAAGRRFAETVKAAYSFRCVVCSHRYPKLGGTTSAGVDGAHILPYRRYDLNQIVNGLCLCKVCHWAFDNAVIRIDYRRRTRHYVISIPRSVRAEARAIEFDLSYFEQYEGPIARSRLPDAESLWPSQTYLAELNGQLFP